MDINNIMVNKGCIPWNKGKTGIYSKATREKISKTLKRKFASGELESPLKKAKYRHTWTGKKRSEETKKKVSDSLKEGYASGKIKHPFKGKTHTPEARKKISETHKGVPSWNKGLICPQWSGEKHPNWRGGTSFEPYGFEFNAALKKAIRQRDNYTCQICGKGARNVHHIDYDKKNNNPKNLITLCGEHHSKTNFNREYWIEYFMGAIA